MISTPQNSKTPTLREYKELVRGKELSPEEYTVSFLKEAQQINKKHHYITTFCNEKETTSKFSGLPITVKDCICVKNVETTASSAILKGYKPPFHATSIQQLLKTGAIITGKTVQDEFGFGGFSTNTGIGIPPPTNPHDETRVCGGSSGGSAGITAATTHAHASIAESTGGSIVTPASYCGVVGLCPTYGRVSRYGLLDYASSLDKIGPITKTVEDAALILEFIAGRDEKDPTTLHEPVPSYTKALGVPIKGKRIGLIAPEGTNETILDNLHETAAQLEEEGAATTTVTLPITDEYAIPAYYLIALAEASTNLAKYCGLRYGHQEAPTQYYNEYFSHIRSTMLGKEAKRRILLGTFARMAGYRNAYYIKALQARTHIIKEYHSLFNRVDALITPTMPILPPTFKELEHITPLQSYLMDKLTVGPNIAGLPHLTLPTGKKGALPIGLTITANHCEESKLITIGSALERLNQ